MSEDLLGKKLYFVNAPTVLKEYIDELWNFEIEAYAISDFSILVPILRANNSALVFFNFEAEKQAAEKLQRAIETLRTDNACKNIGIGLFSVRDLTNQFVELSKTIRFECGYFTVTDKQRVLQSILQICTQNAVKGRRKYIRVKCPLNYTAFNCLYKGHMVRGQIRDISVAGMAVIFEKQDSLPLNVKISDIQLNLHGIVLSVGGIPFKMYNDTEIPGQPVMVILFDPKSLDKVKENKIHSFIRQKLQKELESQINSCQNA